MASLLVTDITNAIQVPQLYKASEIIGGHVVMNGIRPIQYTGGFTAVFPFIDCSGKKIAVRCWHKDINEAKKRSFAISEYLNKEKNPYFVNFKYTDNAIVIKQELHPIIVMEWIEGKPLKEYINENTNQNSILQLAERFKEMVAELHKKGIAHGDLQHGNILVKADGSLVLVDYDSMYVEPLKGMSDTIKGLPGYQHPARMKNQYLNPKLDYFSELIIYLSLLIFADNPQLWQKYYDTEDLLFSKDDFANIKSSDIYKKYYNSSNTTIAELMQKLEESLLKTDIQQLLPLEDLLVDRVAQTIESIMGKIDTPPNPPQPRKPKIYPLPDIDSITSKF